MGRRGTFKCELGMQNAPPGGMQRPGGKLHCSDDDGRIHTLVAPPGQTRHKSFLMDWLGMM